MVAENSPSVGAYPLDDAALDVFDSVGVASGMA